MHLRDQLRVHQVHAIFVNRLKQTFDHGRSEHPRLFLRQRTGVFDLDRIQRPTDPLDVESSEPFGQFDVRRQFRRERRRDERRVHREPRRTSFQHGQHFTRDFKPHAHLRFLGRAADMRRNHNARVLPQTLVVRRLVLKHVERRAREFSRVQRGEQRFMIYQGPARDIEQARARFHHFEFPRPDQFLRLACDRRVQRNEIRGAQQLLERDEFDLHRLRPFCGYIRIERHDLHAQPGSSAGDLTTHSPQAH